MLHVALVSPGMMGSALARRLTENGVTVSTSLDGRSSASASRARDAGMQPLDDSDLMQARFFLSVVPPGDALALAHRFAPHLAAAPRKPAFVECNAVSPATLAAIASVIAPTGAPFIDAGIIGLPPKPATPGPVIYCSGPEAAALQTLAAHGLRIREVAGPIGAASALKMSYAGITKGLIAIASAMALGAAGAGTREALVAELAESQPQLLATLQKMVPDMPPKAWRWVAEMHEIAAFLESVPAGGSLYSAIAAFYSHIAGQYPDGADVATLATAFRQSP